MFTPGGGGEAGSMEGLRGRETGQDEDPGPFPALPLLIYCIPFCGGESGESQEGLREGETRQYPPQYFTPRIQVSQNDWQRVCTAHLKIKESCTEGLNTKQGRIC
jgi:hypothetical protein